MFTIKTSTIRERTTNGPTYMNGRACYRNGQVGEVSFDSDKGLIQARVEGTQPYQVRIILNRDGAIHDTSCTCSAFTSYWGDCKHIAAVLLYGIDHFGAAKVETAQQQTRKGRIKAREFISQASRRAQILQNAGKQLLKLHAVMACGNNPSTLPTLTLQVFNGRLHPVSHVEQFLDALCRDLPFEIDEHLTYDPFLHRFDPSDEALLNLLLDAYEQDYKATFGSAAAARSEKILILNASRAAAFLRLAAQQTRYRWSTLKGTESYPIHVSESAMPIRLLVTESGTGDGLYRLVRQPGPALLQLTASRNIYLVDDTFYLPSRDTIRLLDPVLSLFAVPGTSQLTLSEEEVAELVGLPDPALQAVCPIDVSESLQQRLVKEPLTAKIRLEGAQEGLKADLQFHYGQLIISPYAPAAPAKGGDEREKIIVRQKLSEQAILDKLELAGFRRQGLFHLLSDYEAIYRFLDEGQKSLQDGAVSLLDGAGQPFRILPAPELSVKIHEQSENKHLEIRIAWDDLPAEDRPVYIQALRDQKPYCLGQSGHFRAVNHAHSGQLLQFFNLLESWGVKPTRERFALPRYRVLSLATHAAAQEPGPEGRSGAGIISIDPGLWAMARALEDPGRQNFRLPHGITVPLRPYQKFGFNWLCTLDAYGLGGILADDMGLGKTLQAIVYIAATYRKTRRPSLVIAPTSLVYNWQREFEKFAPGLKVLVFDGNRQQRTALLDSIGKHACVITSYALVRRDYLELADLSFASCFLDEAQNIKNPETLNARSVKKIRADRTFALTGTPIENSLTELWSIFDFLMPGYLSSRRQFELRYEMPYGKGSDSDVLSDLHRQIAPFILRRMKKDVLRELPDKIETRVVTEMTAPQRALYEEYLSTARQSFEQEVAVNGFARSQLYILALLTRLRQICCHPGLFLTDFTGDSGKLLLLDELIADALDGGHRILIFSQFAQMLQIIRNRLAARDLECFLIDGQVAADERLAQVDRFNSGEGQIFLISLRAGGTGLNLTGADTVIHYDPWWNPAVEDQATDRAYRIGQENIVQVFKLYARDTLEEKIQAIQEQKQAMIEAVIKPGQNLLSQMTVDEVRSLFDT